MGWGSGTFSLGSECARAFTFKSVLFCSDRIVTGWRGVVAGRNSLAEEARVSLMGAVALTL